MSVYRFTRREVLAGLELRVGAAARAEYQDDAGGGRARLTPLGELVNLLEFEQMARIALDEATYGAVAGSDRETFNRMTLRPREFVRSSTLDLTTELFGEQMFAPIVVAAIPEQRRFHATGELGTVRGASEAKTTVVLSSQSSYPVERIAGEAETALWYQVCANQGVDVVRAWIRQALDAGCKAICISKDSGTVQSDWSTIDALREGIEVPVVLSGVMTPDDARGARERGMHGVIVSSGDTRTGDPMEALAPVVEALEGQLPVLVRGSFRRGTDVIKALALGATAVLLGRPLMWGLAAYGADGVRAVLAMLQAELARTMINVGKPTLDMIDRDLVRLHSRASY